MNYNTKYIYLFQDIPKKKKIVCNSFIDFNVFENFEVNSEALSRVIVRLDRQINGKTDGLVGKMDNASV